MCHLFAGQPAENFAYETRSVRLGGHSTSVRLEAAFWRTLEEMAEAQGTSLAKFLTILHDEFLEVHGEAHNFTSLLRCACLTYSDVVKGNESVTNELRAKTAIAISESEDHYLRAG